MKQKIYQLLGSVLPKKLLSKWNYLSVETIRWNICDYAPSKRGVM